KMRPARLRNSTTVFLVGNIEATMDWYKRLGFESRANAQVQPENGTGAKVGGGILTFKDKGGATKTYKVDRISPGTQISGQPPFALKLGDQAHRVTGVGRKSVSASRLPLRCHCPSE